MSPARSRIEVILDREGPDVLRFLVRRLGPDDGADALADVMLTAWRRVRSLPSDDVEARMWLFGVARNVLANATRGERRRTDLAKRLRDALRSSPAHAVAADEGQDVRDAIERLSPEHAELVRLVHWDGFTIAEAAQLQGVSASAARTRYQKARENLRAMLTPAEVRLSGITRGRTRGPGSA